MKDATSIAQLAKRINRAVSTTTRLLKHPRFPVQRSGPWSADDIAEIRVWLTTLQENRAAKGRAGHTTPAPLPAEDTKDYWLMRKYRSQALLAEGTMLDAAAVERERVRFATVIRDQFLQLAAAVAPRLAQRSASEVEAELDAAIRDTLNRLADAPVDDEDADPDAAALPD